MWTKEEFRSGDILASNSPTLSIEETVNYQALSVGGQETELHEFPWAALLLLRSSETNRTSRCGGSLISDRHVLTAGHCLKDFENNGDVNDVWDDTTVVLGEMEISQKYFYITLTISQENTI